ncbi:MAG TPA: hypothetical protein VFT75_18465 [Nocardioidaceae bacterium]|nr:hypothetical protein [Nocardioidaceae bacterium]
MPKLPGKVAKEVENAEAMSGGFLLPAGRYAARLRSVTEREGDEHPYWVWEFEALHDESGTRHPGRQWNNTSLSPKSRGFLKATFEAFGYSADSDTDEMIGEWVVLYLGQETQSQGKNAGQQRNVVQRLAEFDADEWDFDPDDVGTAEPAGASSGGGDKF